MLQFLKYTLASMVGFALFFVVLTLIAIGFGAAFSAMGEKEVNVKENSVLKITLDKEVKERESNNPFEKLNFSGDGGSIGLLELLQSIKDAKEDEKIKGIYLELSSIGAGSAQAKEIRDALVDFKSSGKFIFAYGDFMTEKAYYLASVADRIFLNPVGELEFNGIFYEVMFFKNTLEKLEVKPEIFRVGEFKSAVEPFLREDMSEASRLQTTSFVNSIYDSYISDIAASRQIEAAELKKIADSVSVRNPEDAKKYKLVTDLAYYDEVEDALRKQLGLEKEEVSSETEESEEKAKKSDKKGKINFVSPQQYANSDKKHGKTKNSDNKIAVIFASGEIGIGKGDDESIGTDLAKTIRKARLDKKIKAIVLRINSPGGSALTSDIIWREVSLCEKPIIASMSDVAASGGYYIAMACDTIVAQPTTVTGSIGVFGLLFNAKGLLNNKLGVTVDGVKTSHYADLGNPARPFTNSERKIIQQQVDEIYEIFTSKAAQARNMPQDTLKKFASGRVWTGTQAKERGLVDVLGGLEDAIQIAAKSAGIADDYKTTYLPAKKDFVQELLKDFNAEARARLLKSYLGENYKYVEISEKINRLQGIQTRLPFEYEIK